MGVRMCKSVRLTKLISESSQLPHGLAPMLAQGTSVEMPTGFKGTHHSAGIFDMILEILRALKALR